MKLVKTPVLAYLIAVIALAACSSGKSAFEHGNYYEAVITSVNRLRKNDDHKKSVETLQQAYPMAVAFYEDRAKASLASNAEFKWTAVVESYATINVMYDEIRRSPGALKVIPNPVNYYAKLEEAKKNAAEENYAAGILALTAATREKAKVAYGLFVKANGFVPGYKDVVKMTETALWNATVKVVMEPIPVQAKNIQVSSDFFDDKVSEFLHSTASVNQFVRFFTRKEAQTMKLNPDHIIKIEFDEFAVGQVFMNEKEYRLEKDSVVAGTYVSAPSSGSGGKVAVGTTTGTMTGNAINNNSGNTTPAPGNTSSTSGTTQGSNTGNTNAGNTTNTQNNTGNAAQSNPGNTGSSTSSNTGTSSNSGSTQGNTDTGNGGTTSTAQIQEDTTKVTVCHVPPGNESGRHTLVISRSALKAHLAHGDYEGACKEDSKGKPKDDKKPKSGKSQTTNRQPVFYASADNDPTKWLAYSMYDVDTVKIYTTVKATYYYYKKTTTSKGVLSFKIIDAKTNALLSVEKMPGEYVWISEWATFNGDERALSPEQLKITKQKEQVPPPAQDLFMAFTQPIYNQLTTKIKDFYKNY